MNKERQTHPRKKGRIMVRYGVDEIDHTAFTMNVSLGGAYIRTNNVFRPGTMLQLEFDLPAGKQSLWGRVVWAKRVPGQLAHVLACGMGVRFLNTGSDWTEAYEAWVKRS